MNIKVEILEKIKSTIAEQTNWCQKAFAEDENGRKVYWNNQSACRWCVMGAYQQVYSISAKNERPWAMQAAQLLDIVAEELYNTTIVNVNDDFGFEAVHHVLDVAIARERAR